FWCGVEYRNAATHRQRRSRAHHARQDAWTDSVELSCLEPKNAASGRTRRECLLVCRYNTLQSGESARKLIAPQPVQCPQAVLPALDNARSLEYSEMMRDQGR